MDGRLVGLWSDRVLYPSDVESAELAFRADGSGWLYWSSLLSLDRPLNDHLAGSRFAWVEKPESLSDPSADAPRPDPTSRR
ncbi:hypothetical protein [Amycolatopsis sp. NPDC051071]|uniref:hypothetical protein n=1 Tax=Amycolatopsis sp. NPDC051071 TaxID=3154637 RepID=UPI0034317970